MHDDYRAALLAAGLQEVGELVERPSWADVAFGIEGTMVVAGERIRVGVGLAEDFPSSLPKVYIVSGLNARIPHIDRKGFVCTAESEGTLHDARLDSDLITETIDGARVVIEDGLLQRNGQDFLVEAEAYWAGGTSVVGVLDGTDVACKIAVAYSDGGKLLAVANTPTDAESRIPSLRGARWRDGLYLPLDAERTKTAHPDRFAEWPGRLFEELTTDAQALTQGYRVSAGQTFVLVIGIPRPSGGRALIGLRLEKFPHHDRLLCAKPTVVHRVSIDRYDPARTLERAPRSRPNRIAVIGCGAVGGHVAHALAWSGARELVLVDPDGYDGGNTYRHPLGRTGWPYPTKVAGLAAQLSAGLPDLAVTPLPMSADAAFASHGDLLRQSDAIVIAIGNPSVPLHLNDELAERSFACPVVFTWLEPYGIGGHAALIRYGCPGCFRCLFRDEPQLRNAVDFAAPGQSFARRELGCHGSFTPYGDLDARETGLLASRLTLTAIQTPSHPGTLRSWRGDAASFRAAGYRTSARFDGFQAGQDEILMPYLGCTCCGR